MSQPLDEPLAVVSRNELADGPARLGEILESTPRLDDRSVINCGEIDLRDKCALRVYSFALAGLSTVSQFHSVDICFPQYIVATCLTLSACGMESS
jgi:hypothetical protein